MDTGAGANLIKHKLVTTVLEPSEVKSVSLADPTLTLKPLGQVEMQYVIGNNNYQSSFLVVPSLSEDIILGEPWLVEQQAIIDKHRQCLHFGTEQRQTIFFQPKPRISTNVLKGQFANLELPNDDYMKLLEEFQEVYDENATSMRTRSTQHVIRLKEEQPFRLRSYRLSEDKRRAVYDQVKDMLAKGVVEPSTSEYSSPIVMVTKKNGDYRFCVDYRRLNSQTQDETSQLPVIHEVIKDLGQAKVFSTLDLKSGYWQVPLATNSKPLTSFSTPDGAAYQFCVMPFGLKNAPSTFQKLMTQEVLAGFINDFVQVYLDDIIIYSQNHKDHLVHLRRVMERLQQHDLKCGLEKCKFGKNNLAYLGYNITISGNEPQKGHLHEIQNFAVPKNKREVQRFLGLANWLREFVPNFATIATPITDLLGKNEKFQWKEPQQLAFHRLKEALSSPAPLGRPISSLPYVLQTDACEYGMGAVLYQLRDDGSQNIISYASARFSKTERKYHINEKECLAIVWAVKRFRAYLEDKKFTLRTDNRSLLWLQKTQELKAKLGRWALLLQNLSFDIEHIPGKENILPDYLSRNPINEEIPREALELEQLLYTESPLTQRQETEVSVQVMENEIPLTIDESYASSEVHSNDSDSSGEEELDDIIDHEQPLIELVLQSQRADSSCRSLMERWLELNNGAEMGPGDEFFLNSYSVTEGQLYRIADNHPQLVVPQECQERILYRYHDSRLAGHPGRDETRNAIQRLFYWPGIINDIAIYVKRCLICATTKASARQAKAIQRAHVPSSPWRTISVDVMGPYKKTKSGNRFIIVATDIFTKWVEAVASPTSKTRDIIQFLKSHIFTRFGYPNGLITDGGPVFTSNRFERFKTKNKIRHWVSAVAHQQANPVERRNQELKKGLRARLVGRNEEMWDVYLDDVLYTLRTRKNRATGYTPSEALMGYNLPGPGDWVLEEKKQPAVADQISRDERLERIQENRRAFHKTYTSNEPQIIKYDVGDKVLMRVFQPGQTLGQTWTGPHKVTRVVSQEIYDVTTDQGREHHVHINDLRPAKHFPDSED